jgi:protein-S-isoprenylcysteine O-methyltransferase Ste14
VLGLGSFIISRYLAARKNPGILAERSKFMQHENAQSWDKKIIPVAGVMGIVIAVVAGLDKLLGWTAPFGLVWVLIGLVMIILGYAFSSYALIENSFFSGMVRLQSERGHYVISSGPYRWVRHPGYAGALLAYIFVPVLLNSWWAFIPALITVALYVVRTRLEDRFLRENLEGYREYAKRVRYRLLPGVW